MQQRRNCKKIDFASLYFIAIFLLLWAVLMLSDWWASIRANEEIFWTRAKEAVRMIWYLICYRQDVYDDTIISDRYGWIIVSFSGHPAHYCVNHIFAQIIVGPDNAFTFDYMFGVDTNIRYTMIDSQIWSKLGNRMLLLYHTTASLHTYCTTASLYVQATAFFEDRLSYQLSKHLYISIASSRSIRWHGGSVWVGYRASHTVVEPCQSEHRCRAPQVL